MAEQKIYNCFYEEFIFNVKICTNAKASLCGRECVIKEDACKFYKDRGIIKDEM